MKNKAIFIDKDGTLIKDIPYNVDPSKIEFTKGVINGLNILTRLKFKLIVASNQSGIGRGFFSIEQLNVLYRKLQEILLNFDLKLDDFYFCPHAPLQDTQESSCFCRKPMPGLLMRAALKHNIDLNESWMIGDILTDIEAGNKAGCKTILINNGNEKEWDFNEDNKPDYIVNSFDEAAFVIGCHQNRMFL